MTYAKRTATAPAMTTATKEEVRPDAAPVNAGLDGPDGRAPVPDGEPVPTGEPEAAGVDTGVTVTVL